MANEQIPMPSSEQDRRRELLSRNFLIWVHDYSKGNFAQSKRKSSDLYKLAIEWGANSETLASILITKSWSEYYVDKNGNTRTDVSYVSAQEGLARLTDLENTSVIHGMRSSLLEVAGLCQAYLVNEKDSEIEILFQQSVDEAQKSGFKTAIGEAKNGFALGLISPMRRSFIDAIPLFEEVAKIQGEERNKRGEGHAHNNLVVCYNETKQFEKAVEEADKALVLYEDPNLNHSFSARFRKSLALRGLGRFEDALIIYELHKHLRAQDPKLSEQEKARLITNEEKNIEATSREMQDLGTN